jgi:hypothetical protein
MGKHRVQTNEHGADLPSTSEQTTGRVTSAFDAARHQARHAAPEQNAGSDVPPRGDGITDFTGR